jgi:hypothetical protein
MRDVNFARIRVSVRYRTVSLRKCRLNSNMGSLVQAESIESSVHPDLAMGLGECCAAC